MSNLKTQIKVTIVLGALSLLAVLIAHMALTDIYHGGVDVTLEWSVVRICALVLLVFISMALFTLRRALRELTRIVGLPSATQQTAAALVPLELSANTG